MNDDTLWSTHTILFNKKIAKEKKKNAEKVLKPKDKINFKLDEHKEIFKHVKINRNICDRIKQGRLTNQLTQRQLSNSLNLPIKTITNYENGTVIPDNNILGKIEKVLNIKLRGKFKD